MKLQAYTQQFLLSLPKEPLFSKNSMKVPDGSDWTNISHVSYNQSSLDPYGTLQMENEK